MAPEAPGARWRTCQRQDSLPMLPIDTLQPARSQGRFDKSVHLAAFRACSAANPRHQTGTCYFAIFLTSVAASLAAASSSKPMMAENCVPMTWATRKVTLISAAAMF